MEGTQFDFSYAEGTTPEQILGFEIAGQIWSQYLADDVTINIHVEMTDDLPENVIGGALTERQDIKHEDIWKEISKDLDVSDNLTAFDKATDGNKFSTLVDGQTVNNIEQMKVTNANAKALDMMDGNSNDLDGYIVMNNFTGQSNVGWDYDPLYDELKDSQGETVLVDGEPVLIDNVLEDNELDFVTVAIHEIGHVMGFVSGVDDADWLYVVDKANEKGKEIKGSDLKFATPFDLFRYSGDGQMDLSVGTEAYFSIDGGKTNLANFSTGEDKAMGGDGFQASHWKQSDDDVVGIMDPQLKVGQQREISSLDLTAMDVIGWDVIDPGQLDLEELYDTASDNADDVLVADRSEDIEKMIEESETYHGRRSRHGRAWQVGLWQNIEFQTLDADNSHSEADMAQVLFVDDMSQFDSNIATQSETDEGDYITENELEVEETVVQPLENSETVNSEASTLDLETLGQLLSQKLEVYEADSAVLMPMG